MMAATRNMIQPETQKNRKHWAQICDGKTAGLTRPISTGSVSKVSYVLRLVDECKKKLTES